jgi:hypothetical protein
MKVFVIIYVAFLLIFWLIIQPISIHMALKLDSKDRRF